MSKKSLVEIFMELSDKERQKVLDEIHYEKTKKALRRIQQEKQTIYKLILWTKSFKSLLLLFSNLIEHEYIESPAYPLDVLIPIIHFRDLNNQMFDINSLPIDCLNDIKIKEKTAIEYFSNNPKIYWKKPQPLFIAFIEKLYSKNYIVKKTESRRWKLFCDHFQTSKMKPTTLTSICSQNRINNYHYKKIEDEILFELNKYI